MNKSCDCAATIELLRARLAACPEEATPEMSDSVRHLFLGMEKPGQTFGGIRQHCVWAGMDAACWPKWMYGRDGEHFNKSARAALVWHIMRHEATRVSVPKDAAI